MTDGLVKVLGLDEPQTAPSSPQAKRFQAAFREQLASINQALRSIKVNASPTRHDAMAAKRDALTAAYQAVLEQMDTQDASQVASAIDKTIAATKRAAAEIVQFKRQSEAARKSWQQREADFDQATSILEQLEESADEQASTVRAILSRIQQQADNKQFSEAVRALDQLLKKLKPQFDKAESKLKQSTTAAGGERGSSAAAVTGPVTGPAAPSDATAATPASDPEASLAPELEAAIKAVDPALLNRQITDEDLQGWPAADLDEAVTVVQEALLSLDPGGTRFAGLEQNLAALETERVKRWERADEVLYTGLSPETLAGMTDEELEAAGKTLREAGDPSDPAQRANLSAVQAEFAQRLNADVAAEHLAAAQAIDTAQALTSEIQTRLDAVRLMMALPDLDETMRGKLKAEAERLGSNLQARKEKAEKFQTIPQLPTIAADDPRIQEIIDVIPGLNVADLIVDLNAAQQGVVAGAMSGYVTEVPIDGIDHPPVTDWTSFYIAYQIGVFKGIGKGLKDLVDVIAMVQELAEGARTGGKGDELAEGLRAGQGDELAEASRKGDLDAGASVSDATRTRVKDIQSRLDNLPPPAGEVDDAIAIAATDVRYARESTPHLRELNNMLKGLDDAELAKMPEGTQNELTALKAQLDDYFMCGDLGKQPYVVNGNTTTGHGPQRHEGQLTETQLNDRAMHGKDPMTGTTTDGVHGGEHKYSKNATSLASPNDYIHGEEALRTSDAFTSAPVHNGKKKVELPLEDVFGSDYRSAVRGKTRTGTKNNPTGSTDTDFTDGTLVAIYQQADDGSWHLLTMYPDPARP